MLDVQAVTEQQISQQWGAMTRFRANAIETECPLGAGTESIVGMAASAVQHGTDGSPTLMQIFGQNVRALRERRGWSPARLAARIVCTETEFAAIEAGESATVDLDLIVRIKTVLDVTYRDLVGGIG